MRRAPYDTRQDDAAAVAVWNEWGRITRCLESARVALAREHDLWSSLRLVRADEAKFKTATGGGSYRVSIADHLAAVEDDEALYASVLIHSYAIAESAVAARIHADLRDLAGIEDWGTRLLAANGKTWDDVAGGRTGAVEVAVVRNACAHGTRCLDRGAVNRLRAAGAKHASEGDRIELDYQTLRKYRARLRDLLGAGGIGYRVPVAPAATRAFAEAIREA